jgi:UDP-N-acetyl-D-mannosaminuronate dehydrogenase
VLANSLNILKTVKNTSKVIVAGLGEVGKPLFELLSEEYDVIGVDVGSLEKVEPVAVLHICYPFEIKDFVGESARYIKFFKPALTVVNSTVGIGTTRAIAERTGAAVVNSPIRGKHARMLDEIKTYTKFIGAIEPAAAELAMRHFESVGLKTKTLASPEATELAKLTETTYFGLMIAWAQEVERFCDQTGQAYDEVVSFYEEIKYLPPVKFFPGLIGGHCVMPNIEIMSQGLDSLLLNPIVQSNRLKIQRETYQRGAGREAVPAVAAKAI